MVFNSLLIILYSYQFSVLGMLPKDSFWRGWDGHFRSQLSLSIGCLSEVQVDLAGYFFFIFYFFQITWLPALREFTNTAVNKNVNSDAMRILLEESEAGTRNSLFKCHDIE